jgi:hypothetical protein
MPQQTGGDSVWIPLAELYKDKITATDPQSNE